MNLDMKQFTETFILEAADHLQEFETSLLLLERDAENRELLGTIFRCAHSIKGGAATFGLKEIAEFTHNVEALLEEVRSGKIYLTGSLMQLLFQVLDQLRALLAVARGEAESAPDSTQLTSRLQEALTGQNSQAPPAATDEPQASSQSYAFLYKPAEDVLRRGGDPLRPLLELRTLGEVSELECDSSLLPPLDQLDPEACYLMWKGKLLTDVEPAAISELFEFVVDEGDFTLIPTGDPAQEQAQRAADAPAEAQTHGPRLETGMLRVPADKMDRLVNLAGELVIHQSILSAVTQGFSMDRLPNLLDAVLAMERSCRELQERVMGIRLLPLRQAFGRFPRLVRDLAEKCGKQVELATSGEETELDKTLTDAILDPLTHLVRNAIDHGLETPEVRAAKGKSPAGKLLLQASHDGGGVIIEVVDDGQGLDRDLILKKGIERGLVAKDAPTPTDEAIYGLIFHPGFSTAASVTDVSGRGVGMDIVRSTIEGLKGSVAVSTEPGQGTRFRIRLPLTMAILEGLTVRVGSEVYVMPLKSIVESVRPKAGDLAAIAGGSELVRVREEVLAIVRLHEVFGIADAVEDPCHGLLVIVEHDSRKVALLVDELVGQSQVVIKNMEANYQKVEGVAGATILGDGHVALILDVSEIVRDGGAVACAA